MNESIWIVLIVCLSVGWVITTWIRAKNGYPVEDTFGHSVHPIKAMDDNKFASDLAARDAKIASLEERVQVLERIVTDRSSVLNEKIRQLDA